jgi:very-short-patch-repair endonuclease
MNKIKCPQCDKEYSSKGIGTHMWRSHGEGQNFDANNKNRIAWNKGKSKETDPSLKRASEKLKGRAGSRIGPMSEESKQKMRDAYQKRKAEGRHQTWTSRKVRSYPELFFEGVLFNNGLLDSCIIEHPVPKPGSCYFLDFYFPDKNIDLEIDGQQHRFRTEEDEARDAFLSDLGIQVYRIEWKNINTEAGKSYMANEIQKFLSLYRSK